MRPPLSGLIVAVFVVACAPVMRSSLAGLPSRDLMAEFWNEPGDPARRDLIYGSGGPQGAPDPRAVYVLVKEAHRGFSRTMDVCDPAGTSWEVKLGPEAQPEIASSRLVWAMGYHQPPEYYLPVWTLDDRDGRRGDMPPARFRASHRDLTKEGTWSWHHNPFVDTEPFRGLVVLMTILNSTDLKDDNNAVYELRVPVENARRWYVVKDLGATLGEIGMRTPVRGNPDAFERQHGFISRVTPGRVFFDFPGRHRELLTAVRPQDVAWMCTQLERMQPAQWRDVFRAAGYNDDAGVRFTRKIREKISQGKALTASRAIQPGQDES